MRAVPIHIWGIAGVCWVTSIVMLSFFWLSWANGRGSANGLISLLLSNLVLLFPAVLGSLLVRGKRWVRWLFLVPVLLFTSVAVLLSAGIGLGPDATNEPVSLTVPGMLIAVSALFALAVFRHFSHEPPA